MCYKKKTIQTIKHDGAKTMSIVKQDGETDTVVKENDVACSRELRSL